MQQTTSQLPEGTSTKDVCPNDYGSWWWKMYAALRNAQRFSTVFSLLYNLHPNCLVLDCGGRLLGIFWNTESYAYWTARIGITNYNRWSSGSVEFGKDRQGHWPRWIFLGPCLVKIFNGLGDSSSFHTESLKALITVLLKDGSSRPISLLNADLKLFAKILATRL